MQVTINNTDFKVPFDPMDISLNDFMQYHEHYGRNLFKQLMGLHDKKFEDEVDQVVAFNDYINEEALSWFSFWTGIDLFPVRNKDFMKPLFQAYHALRMLIQPVINSNIKFPLTVDFDNEKWVIPDYQLVPFSPISFNEIITSKEVCRQLRTLQKDKFDTLPYISAIFFRKKNEAFTDELIYEQGERMLLLKKLPLETAWKIAFFLTSYRNISVKISVCSMGGPAAIINLN